MKTLCSYGCGREAIVRFGNGKYCCSESPNSCPAKREKDAEKKRGKKFSEKTRQLMKDRNPNQFRDYEKEVIERTIQIVESGELTQLHEATARKHAKRYLIHKNGHRCEICGTEEWMDQPVPLVIDHKDGNSDNNEIENFQLVCCNCDAQLPTYKSKNKNGRKYDRDYYHKRK